ncbi:basic phospholipase A2-like [Scyliorhinus canicula]|uniref:basic phospholipase A2-like n=1 Tax=Scyliorhinus canicula TaxID=7830 RepID=UPI0018F76AE4|nr:basic phospholipase A2-like [Scyliorhinus canicula]
MRQTSITRRKREVMESPKLTAILIVLGVIWIPAPGLANQGRMMNNVVTIINCINPTFPQKYSSNYGCFCRYGVTGNQPVDDYDRCCQVHHDCYGEAAITGCHHALCLSHATPCENGFPKCDNKCPLLPKDCRKKKCNCDIKVALCIKENSDKQNPKFVNYDRNLCKTVP